MTTDATRFVAACDDFHSQPYKTRKQAEQRAAGMDHMGNCSQRHVVVEVDPDEQGIYRYPDGRMVR